jgi:hypothetical protein
LDDAGEHTVTYTDEGEASPASVGAMIGRYQLLELVGSGGMGMVWGAWDPELERRVALKLVRIVGAGARERMLREGQVLARLSHPNVVPIYDVGVMGTQVYLVMEWVRGETLRELAQGKPSERDLVDAYRQAGAGLAAAHEAGLVHRDFKPANAMRGEDGRVRVLDFGIAADEASTAPSAGTPRYMAPEQRIGEPATPASDQYAFCISLLEAFGADETPPWIGTIIERGTDPDPAKRFASMHDLLAELARDPARRRRRAVMGIVLVGAAVGAFAIGRSGSRETVEPCTGAASELAASWNPAVRDRVAAHLQTLGPLGEAAKLTGDLDAYGTAWVGVHQRSCRAFERKDLTPALYQTRLDCLARTRSQLAAVGELLADVPGEELPQALLAARSLPDVAGCADIAGAVVPPPAAMRERVDRIVPMIERALVLATAKRADALTVAHEATELARGTGYEPLIARALLAEGRATTVDSRETGRDLFAEAMRRALRASDDVLAVEAYARWIFELARWGETTIDHWDVMVEVARRLGREGRFGRALMYNNRAVAFLVANDLTSERAYLEQALKEAGDLDMLELVSIHMNLARLERDPAAFEVAQRSIYDRFAETLGAGHPETLAQRIPLALLVHDREAARATMVETCAGLVAWQDYEMARMCTYEAAMIALDGGDATGLMREVAAQSRAFELSEELVAWFANEPPRPRDLRGAIAEAYLARNMPDRTARVAELEQRVAEAGDAFFERLEAIDAMIVLGNWARADEMFRASEQPVQYVRRRAQIQRGLARTLAVTHPARARELAAEARKFYERDRDAVAVLAELDAIMASGSR